VLSHFCEEARVFRYAAVLLLLFSFVAELSPVLPDGAFSLGSEKTPKQTRNLYSSLRGEPAAEKAKARTKIRAGLFREIEVRADRRRTAALIRRASALLIWISFLVSLSVSRKPPIAIDDMPEG
jgi:hypothetical protein